MERKLSLSLIVILTLIFGVAIFAKNYFIADWFSTDDAFYYFKIAENFSTGLGSTFDGISNTNGYHPLWLLLLVPAFLVSGSDHFLSLRFVMVIQYLLISGMALILYNDLRKQVSLYSSLLITLLWTLYFPLFNTLINGTEALLNAFSLTLFWVTYNRNISQIRTNYKYQSVMRVGITAIILVFSRLDNVFILLVFGIWFGIKFLFEIDWKFSWAKVKELIGLQALYFGPTTFLLGIYLVINNFIVGTYMPLSGQIKKYWGTLPETIYGSKVRGIGSYFGELFAENLSIGPFSLFFDPIYTLKDKFKVAYMNGTKTFSLGLIIVFILFLSIGYLLGKKENLVIKLVGKWTLVPLTLAAVLQISYYKLGGYLAPRSWYWILQAFLIIMSLGIVMEALFTSLKEFRQIVSSTLSIGVVLLLTLIIMVPHGRQLSNRLLSQNESAHYYLQKTRWLEQNTPVQAIIGMTGAGTTSFFVEDRVIMNLDGLVNGLDYFLALQNGEAADYLQKNHVNYIFANGYLIQETDPYKSNYQELLEDSQLLRTFDERLDLWELDY